MSRAESVQQTILHVTESVDERHRRAKQARNRHRNQYWREHDRTDWSCPDCDRAETDVEQVHVHHIDRNPFNGALSNLVALCRDCHHRRHGNDPPTSLAEWKEGFAQLGEEDHK